MQRKNIPSGEKWEDSVGYSRVVKVGKMVFVAGTTAHSVDEPIGKNDAYAQSIYILKKIENALTETGAKMADVVNISQNSGAVGRAHGEFFKDIKPTSTMVGMNSLIDPGLLVEIEVTAIIK